MKSNIGWLIKKANTTQVKVSKEMGISQATLNKWALGKSYPPFDKAVQLVSVLGCSLKDLYSINWEEIEMNGKNLKEAGIDLNNIYIETPEGSLKIEPCDGEVFEYDGGEKD